MTESFFCQCGDRVEERGIYPVSEVEIGNFMKHGKDEIGIHMFEVIILQFIKIPERLVELKIGLQLITVKQCCRKKGRPGIRMYACYTGIGLLKKGVLLQDLLYTGVKVLFRLQVLERILFKSQVFSLGGLQDGK